MEQRCQTDDLGAGFEVAKWGFVRHRWTLLLRPVRFKPISSDRNLGADSSPAFVRAPEGNGCAERFIRTLKENLLWVRWFDTVEELRHALLDFQRTYNEQWIIQRHRHRSPAAIRKEQTVNIKQAA